MAQVETCASCRHWRPDGAEQSTAPCAALPGHYSHSYWCDFWEALSPDVTAEDLAVAMGTVVTAVPGK